jgi:hypothetical protein
MKTLKRGGIWMDNSAANIIEFAIEPPLIITIEPDSGNHPANAIVIGEKRIHNKELQHQKEYFKKLSEVILYYDEIILFGPTNAKTELYNILKQNHHFSHIKIEIQTTDNLTPDQQIAFVRDYFSKINNHA